MNIISLGSFVANDKTRRLIKEVLDSGRLSYGPMSVEYEKRFAFLHGCGYGVVSNSGTSSLHVAIQALKEMRGWADGDEVIVPAVTFVATVNVILHNNLKPVFVDVCMGDYCIDVGLIERAITPRTVAIMPVHMFGHPADMGSIMEIAGEHKLAVVEDACEAMMAECYEHPVGSWGNVACFSTYAAHHMVTGVGGMAVTNDESLAMYMRSLVNHGLALGELPNGQNYDPSFLARKFTFDKIGHSFRITEIEAAIGLSLLDGIYSNIETRRLNAGIISGGLSGLWKMLNLPVERVWARNSWMVYPIVLTDFVSRASVMQNLNSRGIETRLMMPLVMQPCYRNLEIDFDSLPVAMTIDSHGFYVGCHQYLSTDDIEYLVDGIRDSAMEGVR